VLRRALVCAHPLTLEYTQRFTLLSCFARLAEAAVFALLAAPTLLLQTGFGEWIITLTLLAGFVGGAVAGGLAGM
jgi:hypothetical protein